MTAMAFDKDHQPDEEGAASLATPIPIHDFLKYLNDKVDLDRAWSIKDKEASNKVSREMDYFFCEHFPYTNALVGGIYDCRLTVSEAISELLEHVDPRVTLSREEQSELVESIDHLLASQVYVDEERETKGWMRGCLAMNDFRTGFLACLR